MTLPRVVALRLFVLLPHLAALVCAARAADGDIPDEFRIKRQEVFEFAENPVVVRKDSALSVRFAVKSACDVTVVIEDTAGRILRHLACGVLGPNAPAPFQANTLTQVLTWDGKDDRGKYVDPPDNCKVRVSLGLKPRLERVLNWSPHKRISNIAPLLAAQPEGTYVFEGQGIDSLKLFDHAGQYVRTIYPFPADKLDKVVGLQTHQYIQDNKTLPLKIGYHQATLLSSGSSSSPADQEGHYGGYAASAMAVHNGRIALAHSHLNRLATDGTSGGLPLKGPQVGFELQIRGLKRIVGPTSIAFSPDGKWLYLTGYIWKDDFWATSGNCYHAVLRMEYEKDEEPKVFLGQLKSDDGYGDGEDRFCSPMSVECDSAGRVYVCDFGNNRIQVFSPEGKLLKSIPAQRPVKVFIHPQTGEISSFSAGAIGPSSKIQKERGLDLTKIKPTLSRLGTFDKPAAGAPADLPLGAADGSGGWTETGGQVHQVALDFWSKPEQLWAVGRKPTVGVAEGNWSGGGSGHLYGDWERRGIRILKPENNGWKVACDFGVLAKEAVVRVTPPAFSRQRLYVHPHTGKLYVGEDNGFCKSFDELVAIDPETGKIETIDLPFDAEDMAFDLEGFCYLRTDIELLRFDPKTWTEVPFDYGEERQRVYFQTFSAPRRSIPAKSAVVLPGGRPVYWHMGGMSVSPRGHIAVTLYVRDKKPEQNPKNRSPHEVHTPKPYTPKLYPGRAGRYVVHVLDQKGKLIMEDAVPGLVGCDGIGIDEDDQIYLMASTPRVIAGKNYFDGFSESLMKLAPGSKFISSERADVVAGDGDKPARPPDVTRSSVGATWVEGAKWIYGGVGYGGQGGSCVCWNSRFTLDLLKRSFVPEGRRFQIAVLDGNGNLILRIGRYGNADSAGPNSKVPLGGDEVGLMHAYYVGVDTDRRLYISDPGNGRILSVALEYHASQSLELKAAKQE